MSENNQNPNPEPAPAPESDPAPEATPVAVELKPLTDAEMESMTTAEITAHAEKIEAQVKNAKQQTPDEIRANQIQRAKKAQEKAFGQTTAAADPAAPEAEKPKDIATADVLTLAKSDFELGSPEQLLLQQRVEQGIIKSYAEGLTHVGVSAELTAMKADKNATAVIDENDTSENQLKTKKEAVAHARATGEIPDDPSIQKAIVEDNISRMSSLN